MEDGQPGNLKIGAIIQARMGSSRLPGKILLKMPVSSGKPLLQWIVDGLKESKVITDIVLATSIEAENDALIDFAKENKILFFRGSESDVLSRFIEVTKIHNFDHVVRVTGDNPVFDISLWDEVILEHIRKRVHFTTSKGLPIGMNIEVVQAKSLIGLLDFDLQDSDREHVTYFFRRTKEFIMLEYPFTFDFGSSIRVTVDYPPDFATVCLLLEVSMSTSKKGMELIRYLQETMPWVWEINKDQIQKGAYQNPQEELIAACQILDKMDMRVASKLVNDHLQSLNF
jgi:spore coat polysaccharide biosynthesis protein SpsF